MGTLGISSNTRTYYFPYMIVCLSIGLVFIAFIWWLQGNELGFENQYRKRIRTPNEYALELRNFPEKMNSREITDAIFE